jgi:hypothetical protein
MPGVSGHSRPAGVCRAATATQAQRHGRLCGRMRWVVSNAHVTGQKKRKDKMASPCPSQVQGSGPAGCCAHSISPHLQLCYLPGVKEICPSTPPPPHPPLCCPPGVKEIGNACKQAASDAMSIYLACARETLAATGGYECKEVAREAALQLPLAAASMLAAWWFDGASCPRSSLGLVCIAKRSRQGGLPADVQHQQDLACPCHACAGGRADAGHLPSTHPCPGVGAIPAAGPAACRVAAAAQQPDQRRRLYDG